MFGFQNERERKRTSTYTSVAQRRDQKKTGEKNLCFTTRNPTTAPGIGDRLNSANRKSFVFDGGKKLEWLDTNSDGLDEGWMERERHRERDREGGIEIEIEKEIDRVRVRRRMKVAKRSFTLFSVTFGVLLAFQEG